jgi:hypothetical protein
MQLVLHTCKDLLSWYLTNWLTWTLQQQLCLKNPQSCSPTHPLQWTHCSEATYEGSSFSCTKAYRTTHNILQQPHPSQLTCWDSCPYSTESDKGHALLTPWFGIRMCGPVQFWWPTSGLLWIVCNWGATAINSFQKIANYVIFLILFPCHWVVTSLFLCITVSQNNEW